MSDLAHFVISRFNLRLWYREDKRSRPIQTEEWLARRFDIFERYCLPSMAGQTCREFTWLCLFDADTPAVWRERLEGYRKACPMLRPVFYTAEQAADLGASLRGTIRELTAAPWVLTTNLDNDDALSVHAVAELQAAFSPEKGDKTVYSLLYGYQYLTGMRLALKMRYTNNHFLSLAERNDERLETIVAYHHARVVSHLGTVFVGTRQGMWLEVVHAGNVSNELRINAHVRNIPILRGRTFDDFGLPLRVSACRQVMVSVFVLPWAFLMTGIRRLATKHKRKKNPLKE